MTFRRKTAEVKHYGKTKSVTLLIFYEGQLEEDSAVAKESMALLVGDAWRDYVVELGLDPVKTMEMIDAHTKKERGV